MASLLTERDGPVFHVRLNRPDVRNAFDEEVIASLTAAAREAVSNREIRAMVLSGTGKAFCAGADLAWMTKAIAYTREENRRDAEDLARMLETLDTLPVPLIGRVHGAALGGGAGLVAVCDIAIAADDATFGFTDRSVGGAGTVPDRESVQREARATHRSHSQDRARVRSRQRG